jgi:hypothetical protein
VVPITGRRSHALFSPGTYFLNVGSQSNAIQREHAAIKEYVGGMNEIAFKNYNPNSTPIFDDPGSWTTIDMDYSASFHYADMSMGGDPDYNKYINAWDVCMYS